MTASKTSAHSASFFCYVKRKKEDYKTLRNGIYWRRALDVSSASLGGRGERESLGAWALGRLGAWAPGLEKARAPGRLSSLSSLQASLSKLVTLAGQARASIHHFSFACCFAIKNFYAGKGDKDMANDIFPV